MDILQALSEVYKGLGDTLAEVRMQAVVPADVKKGELPLTVDGKEHILQFTGERGCAKVVYAERQIALFYTNVTGDDVSDEDYSRGAVTGLDPDYCDDRDIKYVINEFTETLLKYFSKKAVRAGKSNLPKPVSKTAAKNGLVAYDPNTLGSRFTTIFPDLREEYRQNVERYGTFLPEEFFLQYGNRAILDTLQKNDKTKMKKLFNLLNEIYEDGTNETQSLIAVTLLGGLGNDPTLLANAGEYMSEDLGKEVRLINKYLASTGGKRAVKKLENPPPYKPKKDKSRKKKKSILA